MHGMMKIYREKDKL